jgi:serine/threonine-protein kinase
MPIRPGQTLLHYRIVDKLGEGGMGVVWRATDTTLDREVAIKVLPAEFAADADRLARFEREAKLLATLNHPNVAAIYGLHEANGVRVIAMELVGGEDLSQRIARVGALPVAEALGIASQIAEGLSAAHKAGVIHRDLKPANVKLTDEGKVKVLDFGLAKSHEQTSTSGSETMAQSPTVTSAGTMVGMILGTAAYMSPEQARGHTVDQQADVWAFGIVLYEMLSGRTPFDGPTVTDTLGAIIHRELDWETLPVGTPPSVRRLLRRCLAKEPKRRLHSIADTRLELEEEPEASLTADPNRQMRRLRLVTGLALAIAVVFAAMALWALRPGEPVESAAVRRLSIVSDSLSVAGVRASYHSRQGLDISRDGQRVAFVGKDAIYLRRMDQANAAPIPGTEGAGVVGLSPDGEWLVFGRGGQLIKVPLSGGAPVDVAELAGGSDGAISSIDWSRDGNIYFAGGFDGYQALFRVPERGGRPELLREVSDAQGIRRDMGSLQLIDGDRKLLFTTTRGNQVWHPDSSEVVVLDLDSGEETVVVDSGGFARYIPSGHLLVARGSDDFVLVPFDLDRLEATGTGVPYRAGLIGRGNGMMANLAFSDDGTMIHEVGGADHTAREIVWLGLDGERSASSAGSRRFTTAKLSDDGDRVAVTIANDKGRDELWLHDTERGGLTKLTVDDHDYGYPTWMPDGQSLIYMRVQRGQEARIHRWNVLTGEEPQVLLDPGTVWYVPEDVSPDGLHLIGFVWDQETDKHWDLEVVPLQGEPTPRRFAVSPSHEMYPQFSPDGEWVAYAADRSGTFEIYVKRFPEEGATIQISQGGGERPFWDPRGGKLYYLTDEADALMAVDITLSAPPRVGTPERVVGIPPNLGPDGWAPWGSIAADGRLLLLSDPARSATHLNVVLGWFEELKGLAP